MVLGPRNHASGVREKLLGEAISAVREEIRDSETGSAHPASPRRFRTCTANAGTNKSRTRRDQAVNNDQRLQRSSFGVFDLFLGRIGRRKAAKFGDSFWRRPWPCAIRTWPLLRQGYCDVRRHFVHYHNRVYPSSNARIGEALDSARFGDQQHCLDS